MNRTDIRDRLCFFLARMLFPCILAVARIRRLFIRDNATSNKKSVLVLSDHRLGDTVYLIPLFEALRRAFPKEKYRLSVVVQPSLRELARKMPWFDEVCSDGNRERHPLVWLLGGSLWRAASRRVDILIDTSRIRVVGHDWLNILWSPLRSVAYDSKLDQTVFPFVGDWQLKHGDKRWSHLVPTAGSGAIEDDFQTFVDAVDDSGTIVDKSFSWTCSSGIVSPKPGIHVVLVPGANDAYRRWSVDSFRELVSRLLRKHPDFRFSVVGASSEIPLGNTLSESFPGIVENLCGKTDIVRLAAAISPDKGRRIVVSNETGTAHLAAVQGTKTVVILGGGDFGALFPTPHRPNVSALFHHRDCFGCGWRCSLADLEQAIAPCVNDIQVETVLSTIEGLLAT